jgi:uncharacterized protein (DUF2267 family)
VEAKEFIRTVAQRSALSREEAADLTRAALGTLAARLSRGEARRLASQLPEPLPESIPARTTAAENFGLDEFIRRVGEHTGLTVGETTTGVRAVLTTLHELLGDERFEHVTAQLPAGFREMAELS